MSDIPLDPAELTRLGITTVPSNRYHYREWRYSNAADALTQARRDEAAGGN